MDFAGTRDKIEKAATVSGWIVLRPDNPHVSGRVMMKYPADGMGRLRVVAWLHGAPPNEFIRHHGHAAGCGYDKATAAMAGAAYVDAKTGERKAIQADGFGWESQLRDAGFIIHRAV